MPTSIKIQRAPIGVFDSGLGGLTVVKELIKFLPNEDIVYFGDTARVPYGTKSTEAIIRFSIENTRLLLKHGVKCVVVACNSSSSCAIPKLRRDFQIPVFGVIEPGAKKACSVTGHNRIGVIATSATVKSGAYVKAIRKVKARAKVVQKNCPLFVPLVEEGWFRHKPTRDVAKVYLKELKSKKVDCLILGCTHYPLIKSVIRKEMGPKVALIDSAQEVAKEVKRQLARRGLLTPKTTKGRHKYLISDRPREFERLAENFLGHPIKKVRRVFNV